MREARALSDSRQRSLLIKDSMTHTSKKAAAVPTKTAKLNDLRLGAARKRLANCRGQEDAIEAVREIVANFLGSEEMALFDFRSDEARTLWSFGAHAEKCNPLEHLGEKELESIVRGECRVENINGHSTSAKKLRALVPLRLKDHTVGVLAILQLLPQKSGFDEADMDLLQLLSDEAGKALFDSASAAPE